jgi:hypothetical protein
MTLTDPSFVSRSISETILGQLQCNIAEGDEIWGKCKQAAEPNHSVLAENINSISPSA